ncbi:hypothetical protein B5F39_02265 [Cloacibacillus sp. An23]|nr:hypothetical protein B5F39_02265 [Cloacibacillus sp. An23]
MTLVENLQSKNITVKPKRGKPPKAELKRLYPVVNEMFDEITQAVNLGYSWKDIGSAVIEHMENCGTDVRFIKEWDVEDIYKHIRRDRELRGLLDDE